PHSSHSSVTDAETRAFRPTSKVAHTPVQERSETNGDRPSVERANSGEVKDTPSALNTAAGSTTPCKLSNASPTHTQGQR
ncbi:unnamed protein product, partial [Echinostoma caproni]|uniref:Pecanex-like protein n=1 Tax=Echinostoma caproni TaxID=27848 RepID=A0A183A0T7_9TREM